MTKCFPALHKQFFKNKISYIIQYYLYFLVKQSCWQSLEIQCFVTHENMWNWLILFHWKICIDLNTGVIQIFSDRIAGCHRRTLICYFWNVVDCLQLISDYHLIMNSVLKLYVTLSTFCLFVYCKAFLTVKADGPIAPFCVVMAIYSGQFHICTKPHIGGIIGILCGREEAIYSRREAI